MNPLGLEKLNMSIENSNEVLDIFHSLFSTVFYNYLNSKETPVVILHKLLFETTKVVYRMSFGMRVHFF